MKKKQLTLAQRFARVHAMFREVADAIAEDGYPMPGPDCWLNKSFFARGGDWFSPEVWLSMRLAGDGEAQVRVNWSAIGAQSPAAAVVAAERLARAARLACRIQLAVDRAALTREDFNAYGVEMGGIWDAMKKAREGGATEPLDAFFWEQVEAVLDEARRDGGS